MAVLTRRAIESQAPRRILGTLLRGTVRDYQMIVAALLQWILIHVDIVDEFEETLVSPTVMIHEIEIQGTTRGDCDDVAMLGAAILAAAGAWIEFLAIGEQEDGSFSHVLIRYQFPNQDEALLFDPTCGYNLPIVKGNFLTQELSS
jgi:hypothetical protein